MDGWMDRGESVRKFPDHKMDIAQDLHIQHGQRAQLLVCIVCVLHLCLWQCVGVKKSTINMLIHHRRVHPQGSGGVVGPGGWANASQSRLEQLASAAAQFVERGRNWMCCQVALKLEY